MSAPPQEWAAEDVEAVLIVEQGNFSVRFQALAPGIWLKTSGRPVDLGASKDAEAVRAIAESIAALLGVPLRDETRPGIFEKFMSARRRSVFVYCVIGVVVAGGLWWLRRQ